MGVKLPKLCPLVALVDVISFVTQRLQSTTTKEELRRSHSPE